eukprot:15463529-Alexandrium_andersonii.AAC.1
MDKGHTRVHPWQARRFGLGGALEAKASSNQVYTTTPMAMSRAAHPPRLDSSTSALMAAAAVFV